jgi:hypothetical protein
MEFEKMKNEIINSDFIKEIKSLVLKHKYKSIIFTLSLIFIINTGIWTSVDGLITTGTLIAVIVNIYINAKNKEVELEKIPIYFNEKKLNLDITRKDFTRQELQGILGILRKNMKIQYEVEYLSEIAYLDDIYKIQKSKMDKLVIKITEKELEQFKDEIYETNN